MWIEPNRSAIMRGTMLTALLTHVLATPETVEQLIRIEDEMATMVDVMRFFGYENAAQFRKDWAQLSDQDKADLKAGIADGSLTY